LQYPDFPSSTPCSRGCRGERLLAETPTSPEGGLTCADNRISQIGKGCAKFVVLDRLIDKQAAGFGAASRWSASPDGPKRFSGRSTALQRTLPRAAARSPTVAYALCSLDPAAVFFAGDHGRTQLRDSTDELYRSRFGEWKLDRPLSQLISAELILIFERREERHRCGR